MNHQIHMTSEIMKINSYRCTDEANEHTGRDGVGRDAGGSKGERGI